MKKLSVLVACFALIGCFKEQPVESKKEQTKKENQTVSITTVENELVFRGDKAVVAKAFKELKVKATFYPVVKGTSYQVRYSGNVSFQQIVEKIRPLVDNVEPNYLIKPNFNLNKREWPKDTYFFKQWALNNIGQSAPFGLPGDRGADLGLMEAWKLTQGSKNIIVAVVDTGIDYKHPDLKDNMWFNKKESELNGGVPGKDDDGNGYTDDVYGFDFTSMDRHELKYEYPGDADPMDVDGHGTHCAGSIGAVAHNDVGVVGVNWNVRIMAVRGLTGSGGTSADLARAINYAVTNKANIISASWGGTGKSDEIQAAIRNAENHGVLFVAASGNSSQNTDINKHYPSAYDKDRMEQKEFTNIISVGASDNKDNPAEFSNYGHRSVDVFAPGVNIISTYPTDLVAEGRPAYAIMSGTSMAAPFVSGVAALMMAYNSSFINNPALVKDVLINTCDQKLGLIGKAVCNGRINAYRAVTADVSKGKVEPNWINQSYMINERGFRKELVDVRHEIHIKDAKFIRVHFDFIDVKEPYDSLYIYDKNLRLVTRVEETGSRHYWSPTVPGDTVHVRFVNSRVKEVKIFALTDQYSENSCAVKGATEIIEQADGKFTCSIDSPDSTDGGSNEFNFFKSEGFSIDQISYVLATQPIEKR